MLCCRSTADPTGHEGHPWLPLAGLYRVVTAGRVALVDVRNNGIPMREYAHVRWLCRALAYAEQRFGELEMPCQVRESGLGDVGQLGIILVADRGFLHAGPWVSGEGGDGDDESVRGGGEWPASAVQARF